jgi:5-methylcytosine-specific restriction endonuclease McrA
MARGEKTCTECKVTYKNAKDHFYAHNKTKDGLRSKCKYCMVQKGVQYHKDHSDQANTSSRKWRKKNPQKMAASRRQWEKNNHEKRRLINRLASQNRRAKKSAVLPFPIDYDTIYARHEGRCGICALPVPKSEVTWDHVKPLCKGGLHIEQNLQPTHRRCNLIKGDRTLTWARRRVKQVENMEATA